jgi:hypothetical protein
MLQPGQRVQVNLAGMQRESSEVASASLERGTRANRETKAPRIRGSTAGMACEGLILFMLSISIIGFAHAQCTLSFLF